jgi:hypothetical protein
MTWSERARRLLRVETLSAEDFEEFEDLLIRRDALETVWSVARLLVADQLTSDVETSRCLAWIRCLAAEIDDELAQRPDAVSVGARILAALPPPMPLPAELSAGWWYAGIRNLEAAYHSPVVLSPQRQALPSAGSLRFMADETYALAAAGEPEEETYSLKASTGEKLQLRIFPQNASRQLYTVALNPVSEAQEVTLFIDDEKIEPARPPEYVAAQQLVYFSVTVGVYHRLTARTARPWVELQPKDGPK